MRAGHACSFIRLLFHKRGLEDSPFLPAVPVEALERAEAVRFGLQAVRARESAARGWIVTAPWPVVPLWKIKKPLPSPRC